MVIRSAGQEDLAAIAGLYVRNHRETYRGLLSDAYLSTLNEETALARWQAFPSPLLVCLEGETLLGFGAGERDPELPDTWYLATLQVEKEARGKGVGTLLIRAMAKLAGERGYERMSVCIVRGNDNARDLYGKLGATHLRFFEDDFGGTLSHSEKLVWEKLPL